MSNFKAFLKEFNKLHSFAAKKYEHIDFKPPKSVADAASRGLEWRKKNDGKGGLSTQQAKSEGVGSGVQRAVNLKNRDTMSPSTIRKMKGFFDRHEKNKSVPKGKQPWEDKGRIAWELWGGDPGRSWANKIVKQMEAADKKEKKKKASKYMTQYGLTSESHLDHSDTDPKERDDYMVFQNIRKIQNQSMQLTSLMKGLQNNNYRFDDWFEDKVSSVADDMDEIFSYIMYEMNHDILRGGLADNLPDSMFEKEQLEKGVLVELEHTNDHHLAKEIAKDHLTELDDYYDRLEEMEEVALSSKASKMEPTNKKLWDKAQSWAKKHYKVHPSAYCVPLYSEALTREGWKNYNELSINDEILSYDMESQTLKWSNILDKHYFQNAETIRLKKQSLDFICTPNHKLVYKGSRKGISSEDIKSIYDTRDLIQKLKDKEITFEEAKKIKSSIQGHFRKKAELDNFRDFMASFRMSGIERLTDAKDISIKNGYLRISAELDKQYPPANLKTYFKYRDSMLNRVLQMNIDQLNAFFDACIMTDGHMHERGSYGFTQVNNDHADAFEVAAFMTGRRVSKYWKEGSCPEKPSNGYTVLNKNYMPTANIIRLPNGFEDVWCPETEYGTWVVRQNNRIMITGNSNLAASKKYKEWGGKWKKKKSKKKANLREWLGEEWVDISRTNKDGSHPPCGRKDSDKGAYPKCRPKSQADKMSKKEKESAVSQKRNEDNPTKGKGNKPARDSHKKKD